MADHSNKMQSHESQDEGGQAQARRSLDESVMTGKGCEAQENMQRGMGHGDALKDGATNPTNEAAKDSGAAGAGAGTGNNNNNTYLYSNHSLI